MSASRTREEPQDLAPVHRSPALPARGDRRGRAHKYGRLIGELIDGDRDINLALVRAGAAWWYRKYSDEQSEADRALYEQAEASARSDALGLWAYPDPMAPWDWRHRDEPPGGYAAACPCEAERLCTGNRGGRGLKRHPA